MRRSRWTRTAACAVLLGAAVLAPTSAHALVPGGRASDTGRIWALDPTFSDDGVASFHVTSDPRESDSADDVVVQPDGKIVLAGDHFDYDFEGPETEGIGVVRLDPDGTLDKTFGEGGVEMISLGPADNFGDLALQLINGQTKIVVSGSSDDRNFVLRLNPDGSFDTDSDSDPEVHFGHDGVTFYGFQRNSSTGYVVIDPDNRIVVAGRVTDVLWIGATLARLLPDGTLDRAFGGGDGKMRVRAGAPTTVTIQPSGNDYRIVIGGWTSRDRGYNWTITRLGSDGVRDSAFGNDGMVVLSMRSPRVQQSFESVRSLSISNSSILAFGDARVWRPDADHPMTVPALAKLTLDGELDDTFGRNGKVRLTQPEDLGVTIEHEPGGMVQAADGSIYWTATRTYPTQGQQQWIMVGGRDRNGAKDLRFGVPGHQQVSVGPAADAGHAIALDLQGRLVVVGSADSTTGVDQAMAAARLVLRPR